MKKRNIYKHTIDLKRVTIKNAPRQQFAKTLMDLPYLGYEVEDISDGRKIVIAKPGGKQIYGRMKKEDFFVFIYNPEDDTLWQITHNQIYKDIEGKSEHNIDAAIAILEMLERVYNGEEPNSVLSDRPNMPSLPGESPEVLLKAYKWIWGQEDVNYPEGKGRDYSWEGWTKKNDTWTRTGEGLKDLLKKLKEKAVGDSYL